VSRLSALCKVDTTTPVMLTNSAMQIRNDDVECENGLLEKSN
jgi:hypothetical protein